VSWQVHWWSSEVETCSRHGTVAQRDQDSASIDHLQKSFLAEPSFLSRKNFIYPWRRRQPGGPVPFRTRTSILEHLALKRVRVWRCYAGWSVDVLEGVSDRRGPPRGRDAPLRARHDPHHLEPSRRRIGAGSSATPRPSPRCLIAYCTRRFEGASGGPPPMIRVLNAPLSQGTARVAPV
jgi:hypothetical protein